MDEQSLIFFKSLFQTEILVRFLVLGVILTLIGAVIFHKKLGIQIRLTLRYAPFLGAILGLFAHAFTAFYVLKFKLQLGLSDLQKVAVFAWRKPSAKVDFGNAQLNKVLGPGPLEPDFASYYAIISVSLVVLFLLFLYFPLRGTMLRAGKKTSRAAHKMGLFFKTTGERSGWARKVRRAYIMFAVIGLFPLGVLAYLSHLTYFPSPAYANYFAPDKGVLVMSLAGAVILAMLLIDFIFDSLSGS